MLLNFGKINQTKPHVTLNKDGHGAFFYYKILVYCKYEKINNKKPAGINSAGYCVYCL